MANDDRPSQKWPDIIWMIRHGESAGNVARFEAETAKNPFIAMPHREVDVPLSAFGVRQATALGHWFGRLPANQLPSVVLVSPYKRARETARLLLQSAGIGNGEIPTHIDERLREKEFGIFDRLTKVGIQQLYPEQAEARTVLGKFYYRPPGGESWCDVILRLRSVIDTIIREHRRQRVLIVAHQVIVNCFRYLIERLTEETILEIDSSQDVPNCSITSYEYDPTVGAIGRLVPRLINFVAPLEEGGAPITTQKDVPFAHK